jgi:hypothetical protein
MAATADDTDRVRLHLEAGVPLGPELRLTPRVQRAVSVAQLVGSPLLVAIESAAAAEEAAWGASSPKKSGSAAANSRSWRSLDISALRAKIFFLEASRFVSFFFTSARNSSRAPVVHMQAWRRWSLVRVAIDG